MLTNLTLENFKAFQKLDDLKVKPITILCGTNSCGKSSILQSILLLKQTLEGQNSDSNLLLNGKLVKLGQFQNIAFRKDIRNPISFELTLCLSPGDPSYHLLYKLIKENNSRTYISRSKFFIKYSVSLQASEDDLSPPIVRRFFLNVSAPISFINRIIRNVILLEVSAERVNDHLYAFPHYEFNRRQRRRYLADTKYYELDFINLFPVVIKPVNATNDTEPNSPFPFDNIKEIFKKSFKFYTYIGPLREKPEKRYYYNDEAVEYSNSGGNAPYLYSTEKNKRIDNHYFLNQRADSFEEISNQTLHSALKKWFDLMKIPNFEAEIKNNIIYLNMEASAYDETRVSIADVGFGVSQIFPIILEGLRMEKGATLMLEQPEIHLHPNLQMQMADYFISLALSGKQVLVETHSDHVINRLVRRIVEDETHNLQDLIGIYFIKPSENGSVYEEVKIDETKGIVNWPPDFFDQTANEQMKIMQAGLKKRKNQRTPANGKPS